MLTAPLHHTVPPKLKQPAPQDVRTIRFMIVLGLFCMASFLYWFIDKDHIGYAPLYWLLTTALGFKLLRTLHEWYHYFAVSVPKRPKLQTAFTVDVFTTACPGEPHSMIIETLEAIQNIRYPHTTYLCDEGDDPVLKAACQRLGVKHITRTIKVNAKAGNVNNALQYATGDICLILDPDHVPAPEFIDEVLPFFEDPEIGFVQVVQAYSNRKESLVAYGAAEQTYSFYGPMMMGMNSYGTVQAIGANCTFRRKALDSIGGHAAGLAEDMHTAMQLHAKGWKSVYVPKILTRGLVPATLAAYYKQQIKWARGTFELLFAVYPKLFSKFTWRQKIHYFSLPLYYLFGVFNLVDFVIPILALVLYEFPWYVPLGDFVLMFAPFFCISICIRHFVQRWFHETNENGFHMFGGILRTGTWWIFTLGLVYSILRIKVPYIPTPKDDKPKNNFWLSLPNIIVCGISIWAIYFCQQMYGHLYDNPYLQMMAGFALVNVAIVGSIVVLGQEKFMNSIRTNIIQAPVLQPVLMPLRLFIWRTRHNFYNSIRYFALTLTILAAIIASGFLMEEYNYTNIFDFEDQVEAKKQSIPEKDTSDIHPVLYKITR
ncbi:glycosyltransferase [Pontibacter sp. BT310]|uniref:Glycosyltransferase n=1 Tax=Pontibacter populi TaxID=890055 RepID=A0ABS6XC20_9BACT|nr:MULTISPECIES: cellulose synthase catalytic subunit [Pontibacter]MBJ6118346.1 glycosyltransferase [Pontibacter sp. BT310]MBR0570773.1 glycosyltransferase [Microvirga sp. STS03]MBW3365199.1 glycosyltransferase [Pontibacter populi]